MVFIGLYIFICVSEIFFFVCFIVVLVGSTHNATSLWKSILELGEHAIHTLLVIDIVDYGLAEDPPHDLVMRRVKMQTCVHAFVRPQEAGLQRETIDQLEFLPHNDTCGRFLALLHDKGAIFEAEHVNVLVEEHGENFLFIALLRLGLIVAEHEDVSTD